MIMANARGRPPGSRNKSTIKRERDAYEIAYKQAYADIMKTINQDAEVSDMANGIKKSGIKLKGHDGTFRVVKQRGEYTMLESEQYGNKAYNIILKKQKIFADKVAGFSDPRAYVMKADKPYGDASKLNTRDPAVIKAYGEICTAMRAKAYVCKSLMKSRIVKAYKFEYNGSEYTTNDLEDIIRENMDEDEIFESLDDVYPAYEIGNYSWLPSQIFRAMASDTGIRIFIGAEVDYAVEEATDELTMASNGEEVYVRYLDSPIIAIDDDEEIEKGRVKKESIEWYENKIGYKLVDCINRMTELKDKIGNGVNQEIRMNSPDGGMNIVHLAKGECENTIFWLKSLDRELQIHNTGSVRITRSAKKSKVAKDVRAYDDVFLRYIEPTREAVREIKRYVMSGVNAPNSEDVNIAFFNIESTIEDLILHLREFYGASGSAYKSEGKKPNFRTAKGFTINGNAVYPNTYENTYDAISNYVRGNVDGLKAFFENEFDNDRIDDADYISRMEDRAIASIAHDGLFLAQQDGTADFSNEFGFTIDAMVDDMGDFEDVFKARSRKSKARKGEPKNVDIEKPIDIDTSPDGISLKEKPKVADDMPEPEEQGDEAKEIQSIDNLVATAEEQDPIELINKKRAEKAGLSKPEITPITPTYRVGSIGRGKTRMDMTPNGKSIKLN